MREDQITITNKNGSKLTAKVKRAQQIFRLNPNDYSLDEESAKKYKVVNNTFVLKGAPKTEVKQVRKKRETKKIIE